MSGLVSLVRYTSWMRRLDEDGPAALVRMREPVNRYPACVDYVVRRLKQACPPFGKLRIAQVFARVGLHLSCSTVGRMLREDRPKPAPVATSTAARRVLRSKRPNHIWLCDLTTVPTALGFWIAWLPWALPQRWPFCFWVAVVVDHYSRRLMGAAVLRKQPSSQAVRVFLARVVRRAGVVPPHLITDRGAQFTDEGFRAWCRRRGIRQRFGAVRKYGSISVIERLIRTIKAECTRRLLVSLTQGWLSTELSIFATWYNAERPHQGLDAATPDEIYRGVVPACRKPRFEPRPRWPRDSPCAFPPAKVRGSCGVRLDLHVSYLRGRKHLPIVKLERAA